MARHRWRTLVAVAGLGPLAYAVVLFAAASGPAGFVGSWVDVSRPPSGNSRFTPAVARTITRLPVDRVSKPGDPLGGYVVQALLWAAALVFAAWVVRWLWVWVRRVRLRRLAVQGVRIARSPVQGGRIDRSAASIPGPMDTSQARAALREVGTARNAIVEAWLELETAASAAGLPRNDAETSSQYVQRILADRAVTPAAIGRLADLFREARFSAHPVTEEHRREAIDAFLVLDVELRRGVSG